MHKKKILIIDDDVNLCQIVKFAFAREGAEVCTALDGQQGLKTFYEYRPDLVILDIRMPDIDGWETCRQIRLLSEVPIIMLTTVNREEEIAKGLDYGADDFVTKPFSHTVLLARARAVLRRSEPNSEPIKTTHYSDGYLTIDLEKRRVYIRSEPVQLTATEYGILAYLFQNAGRVLTYESILDEVWGEECRESVDYVHVYLSHLRKKLEENPRRPRYLVNERSIGYRFERHAVHG